jgi:hypothetical protein
MIEILLLPLSFGVVAWIASRAVARDPALRREVDAWAGQRSRPRRSGQQRAAE